MGSSGFRVSWGTCVLRHEDSMEGVGDGGGGWKLGP